MDVLALRLAKNYTNETAAQFGALKGAPCEVKNIIETDDTITIELQWENKEGETRESSFDIHNGKDGKGIASVEKVYTSGLTDTYKITYTDGSMFLYNVINGRDANAIDFLNTYYTEYQLLTYVMGNEGVKVNGIFYNSDINGYCAFEGMYIDHQISGESYHHGYVQIRGIHNSTYAVDYKIDDEDSETWYKTNASGYDDTELRNEVVALGTDVGSALTQSNNAVNIASNAEIIAKGRNKGYVFDTVEELDSALLDDEFVAELNLGDNLYVRATDVPDYWWDGSQKQLLETQKIDLSEYVKVSNLVAPDPTNSAYLVDGKVYVPMLQKASESLLGGVKIGTGVSIDDDGVLSGDVEVSLSKTEPTDPNVKIWIDPTDNRKVDIGDVYSTDEIRIGTWINGKPIYRKIIKVPDFTVDQRGGAGNVAICDWDDTKLLIRYSGYMQFGDANQFYTLPFVAIGSSWQISVDMFYSPSEHKLIMREYRNSGTTNVTNCYVYVDYIKTTD